MAEYIERERLLRKFNIDDMMNVNGTLISLREVRETISNFPAADVVTVVRCGDCKYSTLRLTDRRFAQPRCWTCHTPVMLSGIAAAYPHHCKREWGPVGIRSR